MRGGSPLGGRGGEGEGGGGRMRGVSPHRERGVCVEGGKGFTHIGGLLLGEGGVEDFPQGKPLEEVRGCREADMMPPLTRLPRTP